MPRARPPNIRPRGFRISAPPGFIIGRMPNSGHGPVQFLDLNSLRGGFGVTTAGAQANAQSIGFGFNEAGLMTAGELLGQGQWTESILFENDPSDYSVSCITAATSNKSLRIAKLVSGIPVDMGTINYVAGSLLASLNWTDGLLPANTPLQLYAPATADATLGGCNGTVNGHRS